MYALDVFGVGAEVGCVVDFVLEELCGWLNRYILWSKDRGRGTHDASDFIVDEISRLVDVSALHEEVIVECPGLD